MPKQYLVTYTAFATAVVTADDEDQAFEFAENEVSFGDLEMSEGTAKEISRDRLASELSHANCVEDQLRKALAFAKDNPFSEIPDELIPTQVQD